MCPSFPPLSFFLVSQLSSGLFGADLASALSMPSTPLLPYFPLPLPSIFIFPSWLPHPQRPWSHRPRAGTASRRTGEVGWRTPSPPPFRHHPLRLSRLCDIVAGHWQQHHLCFLCLFFFLLDCRRCYMPPLAPPPFPPSTGHAFQLPVAGLLGASLMATHPPYFSLSSLYPPPSPTGDAPGRAQSKRQLSPLTSSSPDMTALSSFSKRKRFHQSG